ncbi:hypothetical protein KUCAC02_021014 [Chaenocephalus aceratus]|uniref:Uncharacterized protein n=1 Tax=Chaenocephalus aceratus TaxID=36190 RepID=A0ACB9XF51_CHAAC|nr:hypothetical protein KUCAC02_021014 [Chaenocephalus aceratus]
MDAPIDFHRHFSWLRQARQCSAADQDTYQERLLRLEGDKESLVLQVSILTDQVKAQGEKIRDLESSLEEHRQKLASTEVMLQQLSRRSCVRCEVQLGGDLGKTERAEAFESEAAPSGIQVTLLRAGAGAVHCWRHSVML